MVETLFGNELDSDLDGKMTPEIKAEWVRRLRSGKYKQGKGELKRLNLVTDDSYCCLGVLCEIAVEEGIVSAVVEDDRYVSFDGQQAFLPLAVQEWANIDREGRFDDNDDVNNKLIYLNDEAGYDFDEIADVIEEKF